MITKLPIGERQVYRDKLAEEIELSGAVSGLSEGLISLTDSLNDVITLQGEGLGDLSKDVDDKISKLSKEVGEHILNIGKIIEERDAKYKKNTGNLLKKHKKTEEEIKSIFANLEEKKIELSEISKTSVSLSDANLATLDSLLQRIVEMESRVSDLVGKDDINGFIKKEDTKSFAKKDDLESLVQKGDVIKYNVTAGENIKVKKVRINNELTFIITATGGIQAISLGSGNKISKVSGATIGNVPEFTSDGQLSDSGINSANILTGSGFTQGSVIFSNGTTLTQDNANLFWDDSTNRLGIGVTSPLTTLDVNGDFNVQLDPVAASATGGTITTSGGYTIHTFTTSGTFTPNGVFSVEYLVVGGGGGGGGHANNDKGGAGGGAGGLKTGSSTIGAIGYTITVGAGGAGGGSTDSQSGSRGQNGSDSIFSSITSTGGGGGAGGFGGDGSDHSGFDGGSGGGASKNGSGGVGTVGQGNDGGTASGQDNSAGGGGASAVGGNSSGSVGGVGGAGTASSISGSSVTYAGGGGGGAYSGTGGAGGTGGGGAGGNANADGVAGTANTGGGGGGAGGGANAGRSGKAGGSGVIIIRYLTSATATSPILRITDTSRVGILTTTPSNTFSVGTSSEYQISATGISLAPAGSVSAPSYSFVDDTNTGIYNTTNTLLFSTDGTERMRVGSTGNVGIGMTPSARLDITNNADQIGFRVKGNATQTTNILEIENSSGTNLVTINNSGTLFSSAWTDNNNTIATYGGRTTFIKASSGVTEFVISPNGTQSADNAVFKVYGTDYSADPSNGWEFIFDVFGSSGNAGWSGTTPNANSVLLATVNEGSHTGYHDMIWAVPNSTSGGVGNAVEVMRFVSAAVPVVVVNDGSRDIDFRVESDSYDAFFVDASDNATYVMNNASGKVSFFGVTPVTKQTELTDELTTITFTAPGTPDYAIQDLINTNAYGFATKDEGNTVLSVIANLQARINELETKLTAYGLLIDAD